jgi:hypothetical protein
VHSKMDFSLQFWEQKQPVILQCTQCNDPRDTAHTWWGGRRRLSWCRKSLGGRCHGEKCLVYSIFYVFHTGTSLGKTRVFGKFQDYVAHFRSFAKILMIILARINIYLYKIQFLIRLNDRKGLARASFNTPTNTSTMALLTAISCNF